MTTNPKVTLAAIAFLTGAATGAGTVKLAGSGAPIELQVRWQNDHVWATGRVEPDGGREAAMRRCSVVSGPDGGTLSEPCTEHVLDAGESACWTAWLKCSGQ